MNTKKFLIKSVASILLVLGLVGCSAVTLPIQSTMGSSSSAHVASAAVQQSQTGQPAAAPITKNETMTALESELEQIYTQISPSVVSIQVSKKTDLAASPQFQQMPFFFGQPFGFGQNPQQQPRQFYQHGAGSGFVWDTSGHIITNNHVVDGADSINVTFANETTIPAKVVGTDPDSDLAVLKVDLPADQLKPVTLADSTQIKVGQLSVAVGNPFGLENTMTVGFVSALGRILPVSSGSDQLSAGPTPSYTIPDIIQTDAPINPGNSGGVLLNDQGQVIGVTAAIESPSRASAGVGFAIPSAVVQKVVPTLIDTGHYEHPWLGLSGATLTPEVAQAMNLPDNQHGALVVEVMPNSPAAQAGLLGSGRQIQFEGQQLPVGGDVITAIDGQPVNGIDDLVSYLAASTEVNQSVKLTVLRNGKTETVTATLAARPAPQTTMGQIPQSITGQGVHLGIQGIDLTPEIAQAMNLPATQQGVLVEQVEIGSPADNAGLNGSYMSAQFNNGQRLQVGGDVITAIDGQPVTGMADLQAYLQQAESGQEVTLTVLRNGQEVKVPVTLGGSATTP